MAESILGLAISGDVAQKVRQRLRLSPSELAEKLSNRLAAIGAEPVDVQELLAWERGERRPSMAQAEALADTLLMPFCALLALQLPKEANLDFRRAPNSKEREPLSYPTREKLAQFEAFYHLAKELARATGAMEEVAVPHAPGDLRDMEAVEETARRIREAIALTNERQLGWTDDDNAFVDLRLAVESSGVFVFTFSLNPSEVRGVSKWERGGPPAVLVNAADATAARLFTLMHEYAHLVVSSPNRAFVCDPSSPSLVAEALANRIAAAALIPRSLIRGLLQADAPTHLSYGEWPRHLRQELRRALNVSHPVIGIRLTHLGLAASPGRTKSFWRQKGGFGRGKGMTKAQRYRRYLGQRTMGLAATAVANELVSIASIARMLGLSSKDVEATLEP